MHVTKKLKHTKKLLSELCIFMCLLGLPTIGDSNITFNDEEICINDAIISWDEFHYDQLCGPVTYDVTLSPSDGIMMTRITNTSYSFTGLMPNNSYIITVAGRNAAPGVGESINKTVNTPSIIEAIPNGMT